VGAPQALLLGKDGSALAALEQASGAKVVLGDEGRVQVSKSGDGR